MTTKIERRGRSANRFGYACDECGKRDVAALVTFDVVAAGPEDNYDGEHSVCKACLEKALAMFSNPDLVATKTPLGPEEKPARAFATKMHDGQKYDSGTEPYVVHLTEVRDTLVEFGWQDDTDLLIGGWLHDVVEDTSASPSLVMQEFGARVANLVWAVTGQGKNRVERNGNAYQKMVSYPEAIPLKLADRLANARASKQTSPDKLFEMYRREYPTFRAILEPAGGTDPRTVAMWKALDEILGTAS